MTTDRRIEAKRVRDDATLTAFNRGHPEHKANGDEQRYATANYAMSFTKGLNHCANTGLLLEKGDFEAFRQAIDNGLIEPFSTRVSVPTAKGKDRRRWEAPTAGIVFDLQGPDAQAVTMPPAPALGTNELTFEMAEVYELALLRDVSFEEFDKNGGGTAVTASIDRLNHMTYAKDGFVGRPRKTNAAGKLDKQTAFRGSSPGVENGPYLSQFMIMGNSDRSGTVDQTKGIISYGAQTIDQRVPEAKCKDDYMVDFADWHNVQQGFAIKGPTQEFLKNRRLITTPRDLATYVHFDALYQAYLNACLILLSNGTAFDPAFDNLSGSSDHEVLVNAAGPKSIKSNTGGFALFGGPHILTLVTEVATRALKAVRYQKFNNHIRLRPEVLAARLHCAKEIEKKHPEICGIFSETIKDMKKTTTEIRSHNKSLPAKANTVLLPMAFAEGSPMHPAYGAGHATVAGACVTVLKAFFDTSAVLAEKGGVVGFFTKEQLGSGAVQAKQFKVIGKGASLKIVKADKPLTLEGELNKLAANISIGRNMAGVHYFSDYFDSARMGEEIAIGMLEEQALGYTLDPFVMSLPTFDGDVVRIGRR
ncbi:MAG: vanadium-dependent haloperoxidase [Pseudomonadota bacterium]